METIFVDDSKKVEILKDRVFPVYYLTKEGRVFKRESGQTELEPCGRWTYTNDPGFDCMKFCLEH